jgi:hypothetical protein
MPRDLGGSPGDPRDAERIAAFLGTDETAAGYVTNNLRFTRHDARLFAEVVEKDDALRALAREVGVGEPAGGIRPGTFPALLFDLFMMFFKFDPAFVPEGETDPSHLRANRPLIRRLLDEEGTMIARLSTATDETASALAATETAKKILDSLSKDPDLADWMHRQGETQEASLSPASAPADPHAQGGAGHADGSAAGSAAELVDPPPAASLGRASRQAAAAASGEADRHERALLSWGLKPADLSRAPLGERLELARALRTKRAKDLADLLGRMKNLRTSARKRKVRSNRDQIHGLTTSGDLARVLPSELARAFGSGPPNRTLDFYRGLSERSVPSYSLRTGKPQGRGPVVALVDCSWSMSGEPMAWASAVALTLAQAATRSGPGSDARPVTAIFFNTRVVLEAEISPGERDPRKFLAIANVAADGGTEYDAPLGRALEVLERGPAGKASGSATADLLLVTDGQCELSTGFAPEFAHRKQSLGCALVCVLVGDGARGGALEPHAERIVHARDLARASGGRDAAARVFDAL